jgi:hypothetical protein
MILASGYHTEHPVLLQPRCQETLPGNPNSSRSINSAGKKTYNTGYSLVVTDPTTNPALIGLSMGERTGSRVFQWVWSYVLGLVRVEVYVPNIPHV